jgi:hypothetical protein
MQRWDGAGAVKRSGRRNECHSNSARMWESGRAAALATGYALSEDGLWRQHTWALTESGTPIETTAPRRAYTGYVLTPDEAAEFAAGNR